MAIFTSNYLREVARTKNLNDRSRWILESKNENTQFDIFIAHSYLDKEEVLGIYTELTSRGYRVYVDWIIDPELDRQDVTKQSAEKIRNRLRNSKTLLLALSENESLSKWTPWELGYVDGHTQKCALFPVSKSTIPNRVYMRREFLLLYPYIKLAKFSYSENLFVVESSNRYTKFENWFQTGNAIVSQYQNIDSL